ncbi:hypothetical protein FBU30_000804 [Linnemannia zychae]|nr:hypothetical protein FBU30_000804 [Linnemannia zychae]
MDFFAQAFNTESELDTSQLKDTSKYSTCRAGQGYGCESNSHLRRASSGLEADLGPKHYYDITEINQKYKVYDSPLVKNSLQRNEPTHMSINTGADVTHNTNTIDDSNSTSPTSPMLRRRTSVSNPCLLHHTNTNGSGSVRSPVMPRSMTFPTLERSKDTPKSGRDHTRSSIFA